VLSALTLWEVELDSPLPLQGGTVAWEGAATARAGSIVSTAVCLRNLATGAYLAVSRRGGQLATRLPTLPTVAAVSLPCAVEQRLRLR
jgi:hypothetical protein